MEGGQSTSARQVKTITGTAAEETPEANTTKSKNFRKIGGDFGLGFGVNAG